MVSTALCTHLGINIGVKGPTAFELFMVYRALQGRKRRKVDGFGSDKQLMNEESSQMSQTEQKGVKKKGSS